MHTTLSDLLRKGKSSLDLLILSCVRSSTAILFSADFLLQIALEVHDVDGRLAAIVGLLRSEPAAFDEVCWEPQLTSEVNGYVMVVPKTLRMFLVYAKRRRQQPVKPPRADDRSTTKAPAAALNSDGTNGGGGCSDTGSGDAGAVETCGRGVKDSTAGALSERFCSCASVCGLSSVLPS